MAKVDFSQVSKILGIKAVSYDVQNRISRLRNLIFTLGMMLFSTEDYSQSPIGNNSFEYCRRQNGWEGNLPVNPSRDIASLSGKIYFRKSKLWSYVTLETHDAAGQYCTKLAVSDEMLNKADLWNGKNVKVQGNVFYYSQNMTLPPIRTSDCQVVLEKAEPSDSLIVRLIEGMDVAGRIVPLKGCTENRGRGIYVNSIVVDNGTQ